MKCPVCGKQVAEEGACQDCLPFNLYFGFEADDSQMEMCRQLTLTYRAELERIPFSQAKYVGGRGREAVPIYDPDGQVIVTPQGIGMMPCLDDSGRRSILFALKPTEE